LACGREEAPIICVQRRPLTLRGSGRNLFDGLRCGFEIAVLDRAVEGIGLLDGGVPDALRAWETDQIRLALSAMERARDAGARSQFDNSWRVGDPLPFGLYEAGDSLLARSG